MDLLNAKLKLKDNSIILSRSIKEILEIFKTKVPLEFREKCDFIEDMTPEKIEALISDNTKLIYFEVYGNPNIKNIPTLETYYGNVNSYGPRACYDEGKRVGETLCYIHKEYYKTKLKVIRPFNVFGPLMKHFVSRIFPNFRSGSPEFLRIVKNFCSSSG